VKKTKQNNVTIFPTTRYQGSKLKIADWIWEELSDLKFNSILDVMGGTGSISHKLKQQNKKITYNDILRFNFHIGRALIENNTTILSKSDTTYLINRHSDVKYDTFVEDTFNDVFFLDKENKWIDTFIGNLKTFKNKYKISLALSCLFQACIVKRPYNLFHRKNLYMRLATVERSFGNKISWDKKFDHWFLKFVKEHNSSIFDNNQKNNVLNVDILDIKNTNSYDLVYFDPPYTNLKNSVDYLDYYHFLEGLCIYYEGGSDEWKKQIDWKRKPLPIQHTKSLWNDKSQLYNMFEKTIKKFKNSTMVISWNSSGYIKPDDLLLLLKKYYDDVEIKSKDYQYALSPKKSTELLFIAR
jgi:adenine-specific DNA-methyltransferase